MITVALVSSVDNVLHGLERAMARADLLLIVALAEGRAKTL